MTPVPSVPALSVTNAGISGVQSTSTWDVARLCTGSRQESNKIQYMRRMLDLMLDEYNDDGCRSANSTAVSAVQD
jgi:hypothetical protein